MCDLETKFCSIPPAKILMVTTQKHVMPSKAKAAEKSFGVLKVTSWQHWIPSVIKKEENV